MHRGWLLCVVLGAWGCFEDPATVECAPGTLTCPCDAGACHDDLRCQPELMRCTNPACVGSFGCVCDQADGCDAMLVCENGICVHQDGTSSAASSTSTTSTSTTSTSATASSSTSTTDATSTSATSEATTTSPSTTGTATPCGTCFEAEFGPGGPNCGTNYGTCSEAVDCEPLLQCILIDCLQRGLQPGDSDFLECSTSCAAGAVNDVYPELRDCINAACLGPCGGDVLG